MDHIGKNAFRFIAVESQTTGKRPSCSVTVARLLPPSLEVGTLSMGNHIRPPP